MPEERTPPPKSMDTKEPEFPQLKRINDYDRQLHIQKSIEMGMSREEAERHAEEHLREHQASDAER